MKPYITLTLEYNNIVKSEGCASAEELAKMLEAFLWDSMNSVDHRSVAVYKALERIEARIDKAAR